MKFKSILTTFCLVFGAATIQLSAQSINKAYQGWDDGVFYTEVYCNGEVVDYVEGTLHYHVIIYWKDGYIWQKYQAKGEGVSLWTGEVFDYKEIDMISYVDGIYTWHYLLKGDMGNHYVGHVTWDMNTDVITPGATSCH